MFNFEKLDVWQKAITLADVIYNDTRSFPADERFGPNKSDATLSSVGLFQHCGRIVQEFKIRFWAVRRDCDRIRF